MIAPLTPADAEEILPQNGEVPIKEDNSTKEAHAKLIVTFFHKARTVRVPVKVNADSPMPFYDVFASHLQSLAPTYTLKVTERLANGITQSIFITHQEPLLDFAALRRTPYISDFETEHGLEIIFDQYPHYAADVHRPFKLALFDMDSTLINEEVIDELAESVGVKDAVSAITASAMDGDIDFATSLKKRVAMLNGVPTERTETTEVIWEVLKRRITIAQGARELVAGLKNRGVKTAVASGGFTHMAEWLKGELGLDTAVANHLLEEGPTEEFPFRHLSGLLDPAYPIVTPELKKETLLRLAAEHSAEMYETLVIGDGSNDLLMLGAAGLGIAWRAKEKVQAAAPMRLNGETLTDLLYLFQPEQPANLLDSEHRA